jgi:tetratricopeptide (TPR) repeat protein
MTTNTAAALQAEAQACLARQDLATARDRYAQICELQSGHPDSWLMLGVLEGELGHLEAALAAVGRATDLDAGYEEAFLALAHLHHQAQDPAAAEQAVRRALDIDGNYGEAWQFLAALQGEQQNFAAALVSGRKAAELLPDAADVHGNLGNVLQQLGDMAAAESAYRRADSLQPGQPVFQAGVANALVSRGRYTEARELLQAALAANPAAPDLHSALGTALLGMKDLAGALSCYLKRIELTPAYVPGRVQLGSVYRMMKQLPEAEEQFREALEGGDARMLPQAHTMLGKLRIEEGDPEAALEHYRTALALNPDFLPALDNGGRALEALGHFEEALELYRRADALLPGTPALAGNLASVLQRLGCHDEAVRSIEPFLAPGRADVRIAEAFSRLCGRSGRCGEAIDLLVGQLEQPLEDKDRRPLLFALGRLHDEAGAYDKAFECYRAANALKLHDYDSTGFARYVDSLIAVFSRGLLELLPRPAVKSDKPVFIVGMPRSGTSLVEQILASHPAVYGAGELREIMSIVEDLPGLFGGVSYPACVSSMTQVVVDQLSARYLAMSDGLAPGARRVTDKMPHNFLHLGLIHVLFPGARIIHCVRDALDTCLSCYFQEFTGYHPYAYDLTTLGEHYREYRRLMEHWRNGAGIPFMEVQYEELVADQERLSRAIVQFCGLDWDDRCLQFHESERTTRTASSDQVRQPMYESSVRRWRNYESHLGELGQALGGS